MGGKLSPVIIIVLLLVVVAIGILAFSLLTGKTETTNPNQNGETQTDTSGNVEEEKPILNLSKEFEGEYPSQVIIKIEAIANEENPVETITLHDGTTIEGTTAEYIVDENGIYQFTATCADGTSDTLDIEVSEIAPISANNPYIPTGFTHVEDTTVENGYTIEDEYGNQYVWIPVEDGVAMRDTRLDSRFEETSTPATALVNSVAKYYGFYLAKYEASKYEKDGEVAAATLEGATPWTNVTYQDAANASEASAKLFGYEDCSTGIISSYAWDTTLAWIDTTVENFSSSTEYGNYSGSLYATGASVRDVFNNICDLCGNVREWTTEVYKQSTDEKTSSGNDENARYRVIRSGGATLNKTVSSRIGYPETQTETYWGFRMVLYK